METSENSQHTVAAGMHPVLELLERAPESVELVLIREGKKGRDVDRILHLCRTASIRFRLVDQAALNKLFSGNHQGVLARVFAPGFAEYADLLDTTADAPLPLLVALDQVQDTGNVGALARTLFGLGAAGLVVVKHGGAALGPAALRASAGTLNRLPVARVTNLAQALDKALDAGFTIYAAGGQSPDTADAQAEAPAPRKGRQGNGMECLNAFDAPLRMPAILVLGNEESGIRPNVFKRCHTALTIPLARDLDSLNVAQAGGILTALFARAQKGT